MIIKTHIKLILNMYNLFYKFYYRVLMLIFDKKGTIVEEAQQYEKDRKKRNSKTKAIGPE